ncbi:hypothetical protein TcasGA2_TC005838 [Tribolium castaneum]|uniref:Uncharacterized protein n=1 Tax=Tribolium castaneum TaxID=7070 RepID=D6WW00_TRICA|nr:hypothetical protein TcasGA2_TC005838 [Tribolium castaneum]
MSAALVVRRGEMRGAFIAFCGDEEIRDGINIERKMRHERA